MTRDMTRCCSLLPRPRRKNTIVYFGKHSAPSDGPARGGPLTQLKEKVFKEAVLLYALPVVRGIDRTQAKIR